jgi:hypothetical protein
MRGNWRFVGDGAGIALHSWDTLAGRVPLVGQPTELGRGLHDPGPLLYWLLAVPVHADPARGVLWGAALWCMAAASLAIEAAWSVAGEAGGLLGSGIILGMIAWTPSVALRPYWNPCFGAMFFLAALAASWAAMSGNRRWWPIVVVTASVAAQAHLMFAVASAALTLAAFIVCLADGLRAKSAGYGWLTAGLIAGMVCWSGPLIQQVTGRTGNLTALMHGQATGQHTGFAFALKTLAAFTEPPLLWWMHLRSRLDTAGLIQARPAVFGAAVLTVTAAVLVVAVFGLRCRWLAGLAAVSLLAGSTSLVTFSRIPVAGLDRLAYLDLVMFPAGLLIWLTVGSAVVLTGARVISRVRTARARQPGPRAQQPQVAMAWARRVARGSCALAVPLLALATLPGPPQKAPGYRAEARRAGLVCAALRPIEQALPSQPITLSVTAASTPDRHRVTLGLVWALTGDGYRLGLSANSPPKGLVPQVLVFVHGNEITVHVNKAGRRHSRAGAHVRRCPESR